ncbi:MAG: ATP-binding protein, partial [Dysgonamonadaceae bacterium]|nr:ATP-binding protein [Dysgonamonadaceae bacterium]
MFAAKAVWETRFLDENDKLLKYEITIHKSSKDVYEDDNKVILGEGVSGTDLHLYDLDKSVSAQSFHSEHFTEYIAQEFGWFLHLNKDKGYSIKINGESIAYEHIIGEDDVTLLHIKDWSNNDVVFTVSYVRWMKKIGDKSYYYLLNTSKYEVGKILTSFNNNAIDFYHSLYVESPYFDHFVFEKEGEESTRTDGAKNQGDIVYKRLIKKLQSLLEEKQKLFVREKAAEKLLTNYESERILPVFKNNMYDQERKRDLLNVIKEIYCIQPKIFKGLKKEQQKTCVGFLNLLLDTDERENILTILGDVVRLTSEEREQLANTLQTTSLNKILRTIRMIQNRYLVVEMLKGLVFDLKKFSTEREHIQKAIEDNYWLFGEQFHLVSADDTFEKALSNYLYLLDGIKKEGYINSDERLRRPDIFMCRKRKIPDTQNLSDMLEENIIIELKRPTVTIGKEQFRQVEDYLDLIKSEEQFNSQMRHWKFFVVSNKVDD